MSSFSAILHVGGLAYPVIQFKLAFTQPGGARGRPASRVRHGHLELLLDVPPDDQLLLWGATPHKALPGSLVTRGGTGLAQEHLAFTDGHCVLYREVFQAGDRQQGAYRCLVHIAAPAGFTVGPGSTGTYVAPAARSHGAPPVAAPTASAPTPAPLPGTVSTCPPDVTARLQAQVTLACKTQKSKCTGENTCAELLVRIPAAMACIAAREAIMQQCYGGGDIKHQQEVEKRQEALEYCIELYTKKCGSLTQPAPAPQPKPSRRYDTEPEPHKVNPAVPAGLAGAALLLYYFWEVVEAALIIL